MNVTSLPFPGRDDSSERRRWTTLAIVCMAQLMIVLDVTIVNVALPAIQDDLGFSQANLTWVVNGFLVTFGALLLLAGRLGDLLGRKRVFLAGLVVFTTASLLCGIAPTQGFLVGARFLQGIGAAAQASVILAIIVTEFPEAAERARAMSAYVFVSVAGGSLGLLAGGLLTEAAGQQQQAAERHEEAVDDPGQVRLAEMQVLLDRRQGDVHDRDVEHDHQLGEADDDQRRPAAAVSGLAGEGCEIQS